MAPKKKEDKPTDKSREKAKEKIAVDKTFGLKNKNKSKIVQKYVKSITQNAKDPSKRLREEEEYKLKHSKEKAQQQNALLNSLFNMATDKKGKAFDATAKKKVKEKNAEEEKAGKNLPDDIKEMFIEGIYNAIQMLNPKYGVRVSELGGSPYVNQARENAKGKLDGVQILGFIKLMNETFWIDDEDSSNPLVRCQDDIDVENKVDERPLEEIIEEQRRNLPPGGTPVTLATFTIWKQKKEAERLAMVEEKRDKQAKKTGGKGLEGMSGRDLFLYDQTLFVDDAEADDEKYDTMADYVEDEEEEASRCAPIPEETEEDKVTADKAPAEIINKDVFLDNDLPDLDDLSD
eukprot:GEMP01057267.1.p1 GENE.GEMP01057267.1~~GEMP01057267.1.p1  ORF type:complete len:347 (+),score=104.32 GEMP01057267.1:293-1333(+)